jgi:fibronectin-binding autotransporter adhesin
MTEYVWGSETGTWGTPNYWTPAGPPNASTAQAVIDTAGTYTVTVGAGDTYQLDTLVLDDANATLAVDGTLDFDGTARTIALEAGTLTLQGGVIEGATIEASGGVFIFNAGTLDAVTYRGQLDIADYADVQSTGGLVVEGPSGTPGGTLAFGNFSELDVTGGLTVGTAADHGSITLEDEGAALVFDDSETLNNAVVTIGGFDEAIDSNANTLTFGANTTVDVSGSGQSLTGSFVNAGTFDVTGGDTSFYDYSDSTVDNQASLRVSDATLNIFVGHFSNEGSIGIGAGGLLNVDTGTSFASTGSLTVASGGTLDLQIALTLAQLESSGIVVEAGGTLGISGSLDLGGDTLTLDSTGLFSDVLLSNGGTIAGGTLLFQGGTIGFQYGTLAQVAVDDAGTLTISGGSLYVAGGNFDSTEAIAIGSGGLLSVAGTGLHPHPFRIAGQPFHRGAAGHAGDRRLIEPGRRHAGHRRERNAQQRAAQWRHDLRRDHPAGWRHIHQR